MPSIFSTCSKRACTCISSPFLSVEWSPVNTPSKTDANSSQLRSLRNCEITLATVKKLTASEILTAQHVYPPLPASQLFGKFHDVLRCKKDCWHRWPHRPHCQEASWLLRITKVLGGLSNEGRIGPRCGAMGSRLK